MKNAIRQTVIFNARPKRVYEAFMTQKEHAAFTGAKTRMSGKVGGAFSCYDGYVTGFNLDLIPGKLIVQAWRGRSWPRGGYSIITMILTPQPKGRTKLTFTHVGVPPGDVKAKTEGWKSHYWGPLKKYLEV